MNRKLPGMIGPLLAGLALMGATRGEAQTGGTYGLTGVIAGGGLTFSAGASYEVGGAVGQWNSDLLASGAYQLSGGFWSAGGAVLVDVEQDEQPLPVRFRVLPNAPNPFSGVTSIAFELPNERRVEMDVFDVNGTRVRRLLDQVMPAGRHRLNWAGIGDDGRPLPPGVYWIKTRAGDRTSVLKSVLLR